MNNIFNYTLFHDSDFNIKVISIIKLIVFGFIVLIVLKIIKKQFTKLTRLILLKNIHSTTYCVM